MILLLDLKDSFVHTLAGYVAELGHETEVWSSAEVTVAEVAARRPAGIILSPGPGRPADHPLAGQVIAALGATSPVLGVCLGHQCIAEAFGAVVERATHPLHGITSAISHDGQGVFAGLPSPFAATRYHSLAVRRDQLPESLVITATSEDGEVMGIRHRRLPIEGVQFHPESVLTEHGHALLRNFVERTRRGR